MKFIIAGILLSISAIATAEGKTFEEKKAKNLERLNKKAMFIEQAKTCVSGASDKAALKQCRQTLKASMKSIKKHKGKHKRKH